MKTHFAFTVLVVNLALAACGPAPLAPVAPAPAPSEAAPEPAPVRPVTFAQVKARVFAPRCLSCHFANNTESLTELENYDTVVGVSDFLLPLVTGRAGDEIVPEDQLMPPPPARPLSVAQIELIELWIADGRRP